MNYEDTLSALTGLMGRTVNVQVAPSRDQQPLASALAEVEGPLRKAEDAFPPPLREHGAGEGDEFLAFLVGEGAKFFVHRAHFERAGWIGEGTLIVYSRGAVVVVNPL